ncbi:MAG: precorrin-4 C(11)-methyltransferase [Rhodobacteraceae bacterium]|nr:precorrin-4 C(11)-methyltransferase [Paracoccaceae bacterium]
MKVYFVGAGPGDPDLLTLKGQRIISKCPVCLYAGSLVPEAIINGAPEDALVMDTAGMNLTETHEQIISARDRGEDVARVHSGDPSLYGAIAEQIRLLKKDNIDYEIIPGVPAYTAVAAALGIELTIPEISQSLILTRMSMKSTSMPKGETLKNFAVTGTTLAIHLGIRYLREIERQLIPYYGEDCPVIVAYRASWPDAIYLKGTLGDIRIKVKKEKITRTALIMVGPAMADIRDFRDSALYDPQIPHLLRPKVN